MKKVLTCIECPIGCEIELEIQNGTIISIVGNNCPRGKLYAETEVTSPKRVITSTIRAESGEMIPVKTDRPIRKDAMLQVMKIINTIHIFGDSTRTNTADGMAPIKGPKNGIILVIPIITLISTAYGMFTILQNIKQITPSQK